MSKNVSYIIISFIILSSVLIFYLINKLVLTNIQPLHSDYMWINHLLINLLGYATIFTPGYLIYKYIISNNLIYTSSTHRLGFLLRQCFGEDDLLVPPLSTNNAQKVQRTQWEEARLLIFYIAGLQVSYLTWGVLQEKVMTQGYRNGDDIGHFTDSQFLVFVNRILAFSLSGAFLMLDSKGCPQRAPLYKYVFCSFSNIMSSWCQYEALKYVSFPHQVLAKAAKTIPVMIMGKVIFRTKYEYYEYVTAIILSIGMIFFMLDAGYDKATSHLTTISGLILLIAYMVFDSFTSNWQGALFKKYAMKPVQMMCYVNLFSCLFTATSLLQQNGFGPAIDFMIQFPNFVFDCIILSICSAAGQLFIFSTIANFGPLVFAFITTVRQGLSILLSCVIYGHEVDAIGVIGVVLVFLSVLLRIYCGYRIKKIRKKGTNPT